MIKKEFIIGRKFSRLTALEETRQDPTIKWIKVRDAVDGWITLNMYAIESINPIAPNCFKLRTLSGSVILLTKKEGNRVINRLLPEGINP